MQKFSVINLNDNEWNEYIAAAHQYDFHHTSCYHRIECNKKEQPLLFVASGNEGFIALPLIIKPVPKTHYFDANSVYGYGGPIASKPLNKFLKEKIVFFKQNLVEYCKQHNIISVFSRLHPLINNEPFFENFGQMIDLNKTVAIDLTLPVAEQRKDYRKSNKSEINQLKKKKGYTVEKISSTDKEGIKEFVNVYIETMKRVNAKEYYFFDFDYFYNLLNNDCFKCNLLAAYQEGKMTAGAIFTETKTIMQYHLAGTKEENVKDTPMKLILDEARLLGSEKKLTHLHLGGGVGGSDDDSLFRFKSGFSKNFFQFSVWNLVVDQIAYDQLVNEKGIKQSEYPNFFPLYRAK